MTSRLHSIGAAAATLLAACSATSASDARDARCTTSDDGTYPCEFRMIDDSGSFEISAEGKPAYILNVIEPGVAYGFVDLGDGNVALPGRYLRSESDGACWVNDSTGTEICAR